MALLLWKKSYSVGVASLDAEHMVIASLINHIDDAKQADTPEATIGALVQVLIRQAEEHFRHEERLMEVSGYASAAQHREQHLLVEEQLRELYDTYHRTPDPDISREIMELLHFWLSEHILKVDMRYKGVVHEIEG